MNKALTCATLSASVWIAACGTLEEFEDGTVLRCDHEQATVVSNPAHLRVNPESIRVCRGYTLTLKLRGPGASTARTRQETAGGPNTWLDRENTSADEIVITVPATGVAAGTYKYTFEVDDIGLLDPRIVVP